MGTPLSAEIANLEMQAHWSFAQARPVVSPGTSDEDRALQRIDELREMDMAGMMSSHPDSRGGLGVGPYYRRGAPPEHLESRRIASSRYWKRSAR